ncbi:MAG: PhoPQ-activated protein PqaA family protein, partial [Armatimonadota bacterium]|nr:PhoPQ-activated protein PqaA family protein [Armatimonadota bacterium]
DRYWTLEATNFYFDDLPSPKYILYVPNSGHGLEDRQRVIQTLVGFFNGVVGRSALPRVEWSWEETDDGKRLVVEAAPAPVKALIWTSEATTKDFRESRWSSAELPLANGRGSFLLQPAEKGFRAAFAELFFQMGKMTYSFSTQVQVVGKN